MEELNLKNTAETNPQVEELWAKYLELHDRDHEGIVTMAEDLYPQLKEAADARATQIKEYLETIKITLGNSGHDTEYSKILIKKIDEIIGQEN